MASPKKLYVFRPCGTYRIQPVTLQKPPVRKKAAVVATATATPKSKSGPALSVSPHCSVLALFYSPEQPNLQIAADANEAQWRAQLDLAVAAQKISTLQAQADMYLGFTAVAIPLVTHLQLRNLQLEKTLKDAKIIPKGHIISGLELPPPPELPLLPEPFKSLWLMGTPLRTPLGPTATTPTPAKDAQGNESTEAPAGEASGSSTMLVGDPVVPDVMEDNTGEEGAQNNPVEEGDSARNEEDEQ
ncbi:hypothetical protein C8F04DRAFT_227034 [Mycena alexandri]|uniref:Uncharacterized protein n=1 Tax=Mycena alexandri TaxID=1745969 RepID=A0AAD6T810_9AGAR|nr:hypothetical protein C8F04DRAFT_227034 [Mycena alexandri]